MKRYQVASGSFKVESRKDEILEAFLGTCVGLTLVDRQADVGGLLHILLPEPVSAKNLWQPETYATTGVPLFIKALCKAGAHKKDLVACVAGGALVGPVSEMDLDLDIGGRTTEIVGHILHEEEIPIQQIETGGYFSCGISLNLRTWESHIEPVGLPSAVIAMNESKTIPPGDLDIVMEKVRPIPQIALKLIRMMRDYKHSLKDMAREVRQDQIITAKVIRLSNSALFRSGLDIDSVDRALVILGEKRFLQLVISASLQDYFPRNGHGYSLVKGGVFKHALGTAMLSEHLVSFCDKVSPDIAYTAGLLHDIGKVVLDQFLTPSSPLFYRRIQLEGSNLITVEHDEFGTTHPEVGAKLAERWSLPESLTDTIRHHHDPEKATVNPDLTHLVYLADLLMSRFMVGQELERLNTDHLASRLERLGISPGQFPSVIDGIPRQIFSDDPFLST
ncbi:MAG: HDOD domain-containing protein [Pseudomonadota bacterium]